MVTIYLLNLVPGGVRYRRVFDGAYQACFYGAWFRSISSWVLTDVRKTIYVVL